MTVTKPLPKARTLNNLSSKHTRRLPKQASASRRKNLRPHVPQVLLQCGYAAIIHVWFYYYIYEDIKELTFIHGNRVCLS